VFSPFPRSGLLILALASFAAAGQFPLQYTALLGEGALINAIAVDASGSVYVSGSAGEALPVTPGAFQTQYNPIYCMAHMATISCPIAFAAKLSADGTSLVYLTYLGMQNSRAAGISVDSQGNAWITGGVSSSDLPVTTGAIQTTPSGQFLLKLNAAGSQVLYASYFGSGVSSQAIDNAGNLYVAGDSSIGKISAAGKLVYSTSFQGATANATNIQSLAVDSVGSAYITGYTSDTALPVTAGAFQTTATGPSGFVAKFDPTGSKIVYCTYLTANTAVGGVAIAVDTQGDAYVTGIIALNADLQQTTFPVTAGAFQTTRPGYPVQWNGSLGFVTKLNPAGSAPIYSTLLYASQPVTPYGLAVDASGAAIVAGSTSAFDFPTTPGALFQCSPGGTPAFLFKLSADGSQSAYGSYFPGGGSVLLAVDSAGAIYFSSTDEQDPLPVVPGSFGWDSESGGFVDKLLPQPFAPGSVNCVVSDADRSPGAIAPGEIVDIFGNGIGPAQAVMASTASGQIPTTLGGVQVIFDGVPAAILFAGPNEIRAVVPFDIDSFDLSAPTFGGEMQVLSSAAAVEPMSVTVAAAAPAIYTAAGTLQALMVNQDGTLNSVQNPAPQGSIVTIYATGLDNTQPPLATGAIAQTAAPLAFANQLTLCCSGIGTGAGPITYGGSAPGEVAGLAQINFQVPTSNVHGLAAVSIFLPNNYASQPLYYYHK
jgi:uncharacterized protein (TIGR03437 family)